MALAERQNLIPNEVVQVDLDQNAIMCDGDIAAKMHLPQRQYHKLYKAVAPFCRRLNTDDGMSSEVASAFPMAPPPDPAEVAWMFLFKAVVGAAWGAAIGFISVGWLSTIFNQPLIEITITLASSYLKWGVLTSRVASSNPSTALLFCWIATTSARSDAKTWLP